MAMDGLGEVLARMGRADEAESFHLEALAGVEEELGREHELFVSTTFNLGIVYRAQGKLEDAETLYLRALERSEELHGDESYVTIRIRWKLARDIYMRTERIEEAEMLLRETLELARRGWATATRKPTSFYVSSPACWRPRAGRTKPNGCCVPRSPSSPRFERSRATIR